MVSWNGTRLPKVFPTSFEIGHTFSGEPYHVAWSPRDTGLFYQNFMLGSSIQDPETVWRGLEDGARVEQGPCRSQPLHQQSNLDTPG